MAKKIKVAGGIRFGNQVIFDRETILGNLAWTKVITVCPSKGKRATLERAA